MTSSLYSLSQCQSLVLGSFHLFTLTRSLVVLATKVQDAVDNHTMEFLVVRFLEQLGIGADSVKRDDEIAIEYLTFTIVEGDDVSIVVVAEVFAVDIKDMLVIDKEIDDVTDALNLGSCHSLYPCRCLAPFDVGHAHALCLIANHLIDCGSLWLTVVGRNALTSRPSCCNWRTKEDDTLSMPGSAGSRMVSMPVS